MTRLAVLGPKGTFSDMAAKKLPYEIVYCDSHDEVMQKLISGKTEQALIAFENQLTGTILENLDFLIKNRVYITQEIVIPIHHCLCALPKSANIKKVYSHPQGFMQCKSFLKKKYEQVRMNSTAESFEYISKNNLLDSACIGTKLAAELYGLKVVKEDIEDFHHNQTRFFVISKKESNKGNKASIVFKVKHEPGSLVNSLQRLAKYDINLTKIESRPIPEEPWEYLFYCDMEFSDIRQLKKALAEMELSLIFIKMLGTYDIIRV